jgi:hypothetical protein
MKQIEVVGQASYFDVSAIGVKDGVLWPSKEVKAQADQVENLTEALDALKNDESTIVAVVNAHLAKMAKESANSVPEGCWTRAMASAATKAFKAMPQFASLKSSALRDAVMSWLAKTNQLTILYPAFSQISGGDESEE